MRGPRMARPAGSSVSAAATANPTTSAPAMPTERSTMKSNSTSPLRPSITVRPLNDTARPAVATVAATAAETTAWSIPPSAVRPPPMRAELLPEPADHQQRVVHAQPEAQERGEVEHEDAHGRDAPR